MDLLRRLLETGSFSDLAAAVSKDSAPCKLIIQSRFLVSLPPSKDRL